MDRFGVISADSHVTEPADLWTERLDRGLRDRAPHVVENPGEGPRLLFAAEGAPTFPVAGGFAAGKSGKELRDLMGQGYEAARPSGWDPVARIEDQQLDGVDAEVLYPTLGMSCFAMTDGALQRACFAAYNGWLAEYCAHDPKRLYGVGLVSLEDPEAAVADLEAIAKLGMRGAMIWGAAPDDRPYDHPRYEPFWEAAADLELPLSLHIIAGRGRRSLSLDKAADGQGRMDPAVWYMTVIHEIQESLATLIFGGVLERHPKLRIVSAENDVGWLAHFNYRMDHVYDKYQESWPHATPLKPSAYVERQVWATFQDDPVGPATYDIFGSHNFMWASDFPHSDSTFPESRAWIEKNFAEVPGDVRQRILHDNVVELYGMEF
ncbi:amidohydrolase [Myxococcota bacterium]|nr:amidohydrolase [Myxococcota bacterium]